MTGMTGFYDQTLLPTTLLPFKPQFSNTLYTMLLIPKVTKVS